MIRFNSIRSGILALVAVTVVSLCAHGAFGQQWVERDIPYQTHYGTSLLMDVYHPTNPNRIGLLWIFGSGFHGPAAGTQGLLKDRMRADYQAFLDAGFTVFVVNHRFAPGFRYPAAVEDAQRAVRFVRALSGRFGIDPERIAAYGTSSGGHLVSLLGTLDGDGDPDHPDPVERVSAKVQYVVAVSASSDLSTSVEWRPDIAQLVVSMMGTAPGRALELYTEASPITHITPDDASFLLIHGDTDETIPISESENMYERLQEIGVESEFVRIPDVGHGIGYVEYDMGKIVFWLVEQLFGLERARDLQPLLDAHYQMVLDWKAREVDDMERSFEILTTAAAADPRLTVEAGYWYRLCGRFGIRGRAQEVLAACERAVAQDHDNFWYRQSRGLVRALLGDYEGAVDDIEFFATRVSDLRELTDWLDWLRSLEQGINPFTPAVLASIRGDV